MRTFLLDLLASLNHRTVGQTPRTSSIAQPSPDTPFVKVIVIFEYIVNHPEISSKFIKLNLSLHYFHTSCNRQGEIRNGKRYDKLAINRMSESNSSESSDIQTLLEATPSLNQKHAHFDTQRGS